MKAIGIKSFGGPEVLEEIELPIPQPGRNQVRVKISAAGFNPVDYKMRSGSFSLPLPFILGIDFSGVIDAVGDLVRTYEVGDAVFGLCFGPSSNGSYAEYVCVDVHFIAKKPKNLSFIEAAAVPNAYLTAFHALISKGAFQQGRTLFIAGGSGGVGSAAIAIAKVYQSGPIFTLAGKEESVDYLVENLSLPKNQIVSYRGMSQEAIVERLISLNGNERFYFTLDFVGGDSKKLCLELAGINGHMASIVAEKEDFDSAIWRRKGNLAWEKSLSIHVVFNLASALSKAAKDWAAYTAQLTHISHLFEKENLIPPLVQNLGPLSLHTVKEAHEQLSTSHTLGKLVMVVSDSK